MTPNYSKQIILGVWCKGFSLLVIKNGWLPYAEFATDERDKLDDCIYGKYGAIIAYVDLACREYSWINVILDDIYLPLSDRSISCSEIMLIKNNKEFLEKTTFWLKDEKIPTIKVLRAIEMGIEHKLSFKNIDFETILTSSHVQSFDEIRDPFPLWLD